MTSEQLLATRATLWRHRAEPLLTLEDAQTWLSQIGLCLFLPRKAQIPAPAPSFVEACLGETNPTPPRSAIEAAHQLLARLIESNSALPLNLLGTAADHPDFVVSLEALPFVYALRGDRDWKHSPGTAGANRVSPLITHIWQLLERRGVLTASEIQEELGKELTEAAVVRALHELWASLRVVPLYQTGGQETLWEPLQSRHHKAMTSGVGMSQVTALSVLASVYLQSVVAAGGDDAESFLSPLASRAKVREVIRGLSATRQLVMIQMETQSLLYVEGSLPEFPEAEKPVPSETDTKPIARRPHPTSPEGMQAALKRSVAKSAGESAPRPAYKRPAAPPSKSGTVPPSARGGSFRPAAAGGRSDSRERKPGSFRSEGGGSRPPFKSGLKSAFKPPFKPRSAPVERSEPGTGLRADGTPKKTRWRDLPGGRPDQKGKPARFGPRKTEGAGDETPRPAPRREVGSFRPAPTGSKPPFKRSFTPREDKPFRPTGTDAPKRTFRPTGSGTRPSSGGRPSYGGTSNRTGRDSGRPSTGARPPFRPSSDRPAASGSRPPAFGSRPPARSSAGRFVARPEGSRPYKPSGRPTREDAPGGDRKFTSRPPRAGGFSSTRPPKAGGFSSARPRTDSRPYSPRPGGRPTGEAKSGPRPGGSSFKPAGRSAGGPPRSGSRPSFGAGSRSRSSDGQSSRGPGFKPGGARFSPGSGRPRPASGSKPGGRPPGNFKKRPKSGE